jgi:PAS domain S-box-containing protein
VVNVVTERQKYTGAAVVGLIGLLALSVPIYDMLADAGTPGKPVYSTVIENSPLLTLGLAILAAAAWLVTSDWGAVYVRTAARIAATTTVAVAAIITLVVFVQQTLQGDLKPFVIAADAVVIGALAGVVLGIRTAQQERATDEAAAQRDRFQALFDNVPNPIVGVEFVDGEPIVRAVNPAFTEVFGFDRRTIAGESLATYVVPSDEDLDPVDTPLTPQDPGDEDVWDSDVVELETVDGRREFIRLTAPVDRGPARDGYAIYIDVTVERQRRERLRVLSRTLRHDLRNKLTVIKSGLDGLADGPARDRVEMALAAVEDLQQMSEQTRQVERQIAGDSDPEPRDLVAVVDQVVAAVRADHPEAVLRVETPASAVGPVTRAFGAAVEAVVRNAVDHNDQAEPHVDVTVTESLDGDYLDVRIADDGPGVDPQQAEIAEGSGETDRQTKHLDGLGLWTARWVLQNSGGDLEFAANSPRGTIVTLRVPAAEDPPAGVEVPAPTD